MSLSTPPTIIDQSLRALTRVLGRSDIVHLLTTRHETEVLEFLNTRAIHTVYMAGLIRDNGLASPLNRGSFYACRDHEGRLEGVALIGHATLIEARTEAALEAFARVARRCADAYLIRGEQQVLERFWTSYADDGRAPRLVCRELLYEFRALPSAVEAVRGLRLATLAELSEVMTINASLAFAEGGVDPAKREPLGFRLRTARRIEQDRVYVWMENNEIIFKADVISRTPEAVYLEGIYVRPESRGQGYGLRCLSQLGSNLLKHSSAVCLIVNEKQTRAQAFYRKAGYEPRASYHTIYLQQAH